MNQRTEHQHQHQHEAGVLAAGHYTEARDRLTHDPHVQSMARQMIADLGGAREALEHIGVPAGEQISWHFIRAANREYDRRGGTDAGHHIGAVAEAVVHISRTT